mmetsp:Transcript_21870/g.28302  ORF Transcript_21870/g.28302 Transcript_21870/m.28302 type:complete len:122 (+) Transcript_21870:142-507(+)|eukprot:CAMPEP_0198136592 /NCGR_PEP_ID=MMETSP1443-20131203/231_1 /TAXON_ID=186043 /ORGANISM="Entomoneis sp., Strain CCMP2396" /LENGTH=121 /DNA_ID=CAMNT_0043797839 /DNA_START=91 /DNA_END=456 /DNA_ORIENTATION=+
MASSNKNNQVGVPVKLLYEAEGMKVTVEMKNGQVYRGLLVSAEDTMNLTLTDAIQTKVNGQVSKLPSAVYLKGTYIRFIALPDLLKSAPLFGSVRNQKRKMEARQAEQQGVSSNKKRKGMD